MGWGGFGGGIQDTYNSAKNRDIAGTAYHGYRAGMDPGNFSDSVRGGISKGLGYDHSKQDDLNEQGRSVSEDEMRANRGVLTHMKELDDDYLGKVHNYGTDYIAKIDQTGAQAAKQANDARAIYSNDIQPRMKNQMEDAQREAGSAMTLSQSMDPNNQVHQAVEAKYKNLGQGVRKQGLADYGVLSALGNQATQNTMGASGPMTGSQMQLLNAGNTQQASAAFQRAQQRVNDLEQQGIDRGFDESDKAYGRGQAAKDRYAGTIGDYEGSMDRNINRERSFRDEDMGYASDRLGILRGMAGEERDVRMGGNSRDLSQIGAEYGNQQSYIANQMAAANAENASKRGIFGGILQGAATGAGAYYGGAQGAQAGAAAGGGMSQGVQAGQNYGYAPYQNTNRPTNNRYY